jgi:hypothetical protein
MIMFILIVLAGWVALDIVLVGAWMASVAFADHRNRRRHPSVVSHMPARRAAAVHENLRRSA